MPPKNMDALELLMSQHDEVEDLFEQVESTKDDDEKRELFATLADNLSAHARMEEIVFYPAVMSDKTRDLLLEASEEHLSAKRVLADLVEMDLDTEHFDAKVTVLKELVLHHVKEEEEELFPKVRTLMSKAELEALGGEMLRTFVELVETEPRRTVAEETHAAAEL